MTVTIPDLAIELDDLSEEDWRVRLDGLGEEHGYFQQVGEDHSALFIDAGPRLLVTFETVESARLAPGAKPRGFGHVMRNGWSLLALFSHGETWFRGSCVWGTFDRLTDDGFFEDFERVLFTGTGPCGYAAAAYSVASPGARVLCLRPYATLDPAIAGWDRRHLRERRFDFSSRYGYAPEMLEAAERAFVIHDPSYGPDAMHAALFHQSNVTTLRCPLAGSDVDAVLDEMGVTPQLVDLAMGDGLHRLSFARIWRARREHGPYLLSLVERLESVGRRGLAARVCQHGLGTRDRPLFARKLQDMGLDEPAQITG